MKRLCRILYNKIIIFSKITLKENFIFSDGLSWCFDMILCLGGLPESWENWYRAAFLFHVHVPNSLASSFSLQDVGVIVIIIVFIEVYVLELLIFSFSCSKICWSSIVFFLVVLSSSGVTYSFSPFCEYSLNVMLHCNCTLLTLPTEDVSQKSRFLQDVHT